VSLARLLAHYETAESPHETLVELEVCQELARRLCAEKISRRLYRLLSPESIYPLAKNFPQSHQIEGEALKLGPGEIHGVKFRHPYPVKLRQVRRTEIITLLGEYRWDARQSELSSCGSAT